MFQVAAKSQGPRNRTELAARGKCLDVLAGDGAFAFGSMRDIEVGARILCVRCAKWGRLPHTAGKTVAMYLSQPVVNLREFAR